MLLQLPEEKKDLAKALFKKRQPNWSALWCCLNGTMPAKFYVDNLEAPAVACGKIGTSMQGAEFKSFSPELFDKCEWKDFHLWIYGSCENFIKKAFGFYAVQGDEVCCEGEAAFIAQGYTEIGIITAESKRRQGFGFATCVRLLEEIKKRDLIPIWACDVVNTESSKLAEKLGFKKSQAYDFLYYPQR